MFRLDPQLLTFLQSGSTSFLFMFLNSNPTFFEIRHGNTLNM